MIILLVCIIVTRAAHTKWRPRFWSRLTAVVLLLVLWGAPIEPGYDPGLFGYYLRAKIIGDVPAILAWADTYATSTTKPSEENMIGEWEMVSRPGLPNSVSLPDAVRRMGWYVKFRRSDRAAEVSYGSGMAGTWGIKVGHGVGEQAGGTRREVKVNQDAYVWHSEPF
jgi:hypothetical protein